MTDDMFSSMPRPLRWTASFIMMLFWVMACMYVHVNYRIAGRDGLRCAEGLSAAELFEHIPEARRRVPAGAADVTYRSEWRHGFRRTGSILVAYTLAEDEFRREVAATRMLVPIEKPETFEPIGLIATRGYFFRKEHPGYCDIEVYDLDTLRVWKYSDRSAKK